MNQRLKNFLKIFGIFILAALFFNIVLEILHKILVPGTRAITSGWLLGMLFLTYVPYSIIGALVKIKKNFSAIQMGIISALVGVIVIEVSGWIIRIFREGILSNWFGFTITIIYWFGAWAIPTYIIDKYFKKELKQCTGSGDKRPWWQQEIIWIAIILGIVMLAMTSLPILAKLFIQNGN
ncbi:hypothetical protein ACFL0X_00985 [Nanoarchaeota archaeon]